jgi:hypothetical protein
MGWAVRSSAAVERRARPKHESRFISDCCSVSAPSSPPQHPRPKGYPNQAGPNKLANCCLSGTGVFIYDSCEMNMVFTTALFLKARVFTTAVLFLRTRVFATAVS